MDNGEVEVEIKEEPPADEGVRPDQEFVDRMMREGQFLHVKLGQGARADQVTLADGTPIQGVVAITIEDSVQNGRVVTLRMRSIEVEGDFVVQAIPPHHE